MLKAILFDLVGVLFFPKADVQPNVLLDELEYHIGGVTNDTAFMDGMMQKYSLTRDRFDDLLHDIVKKYEPFHALWNLFPELRKRYTLGIINNGTYLTYPFFEERYHLSRQFDVFISSALEGIRKPNPEIYVRASQKIGCAPQECLFMDDSLENCLGSEKTGMQSIHWKDGESGFQEFERFLRHPQHNLSS